MKSLGVTDARFRTEGKRPESRIFSASLAGTRILANCILMWALLGKPWCLYFTGPKYRSSQSSVSLISSFRGISWPAS